MRSAVRAISSKAKDRPAADAVHFRVGVDTITNNPTNIGKTDGPGHSRDKSDNSSQAVVDKGDSRRKDMSGSTDENRNGSILGGDDNGGLH
jgi:hypothetical protein